jgi:hypothetical protein
MSAKHLHQQIANLKIDIEAQESISWILFSLVGYADILAAENRRDRALEILGLCKFHPETNSDTHRDIELVLDDLKKAHTDDIEVGLERGRSGDLKEAVISARGG